MQQPADSAKKVPNQFFWHLSKIVRNAPIHITTWMYDNKKTYPGFIFRAGIVAAGFLFAALAMHMVSTGVGRIVEDIILQAGAGVGLIAFIALFGKMFVDTWKAGAYVAHTWNENKPEPEAKVLVAGPVWQPPSLGVDMLVCLLPGETLASFHEREKAAKAATSYAIWAAIIPPFQNAAAIYTAEEETDFIFTRGDEPFLNPEAPDYVDRRAWDHSDETYQAYTQYVDFFAPRFVKFAEQKKLVVKQERASRTFFEINAAKALTATVVLSFLLFCLPVFGQSKTQQVDAALMQVSGQIDPIPPAGAAVTYEFKTGTKTVYIDRKADGKSTYMELLPKSTGIVRYNDAGGELSLIKVNGEPVIQRNKPKLVNVPSKSVEPQPQRIQSPVAPNGAVYLPPNNTGDPIRPRGTLQGPDVANTPVTDDPPRFTMPSAEESAMMAEHAKYQIWQYGNIAGTVARPWWDVIMTAFWVVYPILIILSIIAWVCARVFSSEGMIREHRVARRSLVMVLLGVAGVLLINAMLFTISLQPGPFVLTVVGAALAGIAYLIVSRLTPNFDPASGNEPRIESPYGQRRIG